MNQMNPSIHPYVLSHFILFHPIKPSHPHLVPTPPILAWVFFSYSSNPIKSHSHSISLRVNTPQFILALFLDFHTTELNIKSHQIQSRKTIKCSPPSPINLHLISHLMPSRAQIFTLQPQNITCHKPTRTSQMITSPYIHLHPYATPHAS